MSIIQVERNAMLVAVCVVFILCTISEHVRGMDLSKTTSFRGDVRFKRSSSLEDDRLEGMDSEPLFSNKRSCNGFPCMYSHLGTKAGRASLYKTLAGFIDECFSDPSCSPGRRKRQEPEEWRQRKILNTPLRDLILWRMRKED